MPRPSSALDAKASTVNPYQLNHALSCFVMLFHVLPTLFSKITSPLEPVCTISLHHALVEAIGFEPTTPWLQTRCSTS